MTLRVEDGAFDETWICRGVGGSAVDTDGMLLMDITPCDGCGGGVARVVVSVDGLEESPGNGALGYDDVSSCRVTVTAFRMPWNTVLPRGRVATFEPVFGAVERFRHVFPWTEWWRHEEWQRLGRLEFPQTKCVEEGSESEWNVGPFLGHGEESRVIAVVVYSVTGRSTVRLCARVQ
jgi:hypothetical protein